MTAAAVAAVWRRPGLLATLSSRRGAPSRVRHRTGLAVLLPYLSVSRVCARAPARARYRARSPRPPG